MKEEIERITEIWNKKNPTIEEIIEFFKLCIKYPEIDLVIF